MASDLGNLLKAKQLLQEEEAAKHGAKSIRALQVELEAVCEDCFSAQPEDVTWD